ncbi:transcription repressor OFP12-like [Nymphaea colorata]|nr:transcription repressor OFP12-like [Nymphaea colorata]
MSKPLRLKFHLCFLRSKKSGHDHDPRGDVANLPFDSDSDTPPEFTSKSVTTHSTASSSSSSSLPLDLASALSSRRFFFSSPGRSNSLIDDDSKLPPPVKTAPEALNGGVAVLAYSPDPYRDFRASMQEMVEAQDLDISADWGYLQEMLACYLKLNSRRTHKYIVGAFADLLMSLMMGRRKTAASGGYEVLR